MPGDVESMRQCVLSRNNEHEDVEEERKNRCYYKALPDNGVFIFDKAPESFNNTHTYTSLRKANNSVWLRHTANLTHIIKTDC